MINACAKANNVAGAEKWLKAMRAAGIVPDGVSYSTVIHACASVQEPLRAEEWLEEMMSVPQACGADQPNAFCYNAVVQAWSRAGETTRAAKWLSLALSKGFDMTGASFNSLIVALKKADKADEAQLWAAKMEAQGLQSSSSRTGNSSRSNVRGQRRQ